MVAPFTAYTAGWPRPPAGGDRPTGKLVGMERAVIIEGARTFRAKRLRINLGKTDVQLRANRRTVRVPPGADPVGFVFTPRRSRQLPSGQRPCA